MTTLNRHLSASCILLICLVVGDDFIKREQQHLDGGGDTNSFLKNLMKLWKMRGLFSCGRTV